MSANNKKASTVSSDVTGNIQAVDKDNLFQKLVANSYCGIALLNKNLEIVYRTASAERIDGWPAAEIEKKALISLIHPENRVKIQFLLDDLLKSEAKSETLNFRFLHFKGHYIWIACVFTNLLHDEDVEAIVCNFKDISEQKRTEELAEAQIRQKTEQIADILENITDGFIALDQNNCYTYANKQIGKMLGLDTTSLIGKSIWETSPDDVHLPAFAAILDALKEKVYTCNEVYCEPLDLWLENKVYPSDNGVSMFIRDITKSKKKEHNLKLLESVITNTTEAVFITEAYPLDEPGPEIVYVNDAFTKMTGYSGEEIIGKTPKILQGEKSDTAELQRLNECLKDKRPCEITIINYKKNGEEFWVDLNVSPVADYKGVYKHFIAIQRDVTQRKIEEIQNTLLTDISVIFNKGLGLIESLNFVLEELADYGNFGLTEIWLVDAEKRKINVSARYAGSQHTQKFIDDTRELKSCLKGEGLAGIAWEAQTIQQWRYTESPNTFMRLKQAREAGFKRVYALPLLYNEDVVGVLMLMLEADELPDLVFLSKSKNFSRSFGSEIRRKQIEDQLNQLFNFAPDIICIAGTDGYFKKINQAMCTLFGYTEQEILSKSFIDFVIPEDRESTINLSTTIAHGKPIPYFENRNVTKAGKIIWLAWTATPAYEEGLIFCVAKDITEKKELENLLNKATTLARIGGWEVDTIKGTVYWSRIAKEIHEIDAESELEYNMYTDFSAEEKGKDTIVQLMEKYINYGAPCDVELQIVTAKGNLKWIRLIGEAEFTDGNCVRLYGSFQDIDERKKSDIAALRALEERNSILNSIEDAFIAVDKNWIITYWNTMAEEVLRIPKNELIGHNIWDVFSDLINSYFYKMLYQADETNKVVRFETYDLPLEKWFEINVYPSNFGLSVYFRDITNRKLSENQLTELNKSLQIQAGELSNSNAQLEQFAYVASHDLQEPLRMVTSFMAKLETKYSEVIDEKGRQYIHFAVDGAKRMRQIIFDLLDFSRAGKAEDYSEKIDLMELIREILSLYMQQIEEKNAVINFDNLPTIRTYKTPIRQVLQNLIGNSLKYHKHGVSPVITITCKETELHWQVSVKDNGIGISREYFEKIFIIFQRLHNKNEYSGTGIGLAISKKIIENLGGKIWLESVEDEGSTFHFTILKNLKHEIN